MNINAMNYINTYTLLFLAQIKMKVNCTHNVEFNSRNYDVVKNIHCINT